MRKEVVEKMRQKHQDTVPEMKRTPHGIALEKNRVAEAGEVEAAPHRAEKETRQQFLPPSNSLRRYLLCFWPQTLLGRVARIIFYPTAFMAASGTVFVVGGFDRSEISILAWLGYGIAMILSYFCSLYDGRGRSRSRPGEQ